MSISLRQERERKINYLGQAIGYVRMQLVPLMLDVPAGQSGDPVHSPDSVSKQFERGCA